MPTEYEWSDEPGPRGRGAYLILIARDGTIHQFREKTIRGIVVVRGSDYKKNGKWSHSKFRLLIADGVRPVAWHAGWETGRLNEGMARALGGPTPDTWEALATLLGVSVEQCEAWLREDFPKTSERYDTVREEMASLLP